MVLLCEASSQILLNMFANVDVSQTVGCTRKVAGLDLQAADSWWIKIAQPV